MNSFPCSGRSQHRKPRSQAYTLRLSLSRRTIPDAYVAPVKFVPTDAARHRAQLDSRTVVALASMSSPTGLTVASAEPSAKQAKSAPTAPVWCPILWGKPTTAALVSTSSRIGPIVVAVEKPVALVKSVPTALALSRVQQVRPTAVVLVSIQQAIQRIVEAVATPATPTSSARVVPVIPPYPYP